jgi:hypothetical protein
MSIWLKAKQLILIHINYSLKFCLFTFLNKTSNVESQISKYFVDQLKKNKNVTAKIQLDMQNGRMSKAGFKCFMSIWLKAKQLILIHIITNKVKCNFF